MADVQDSLTKVCPPQGLLHELDKVQGEARSAAARAEAVDAELQRREQALAATQVRATGLPGPCRRARKPNARACFLLPLSNKNVVLLPPRPALQSDVQAKQQELARLAAERNAEAERAQKESSKARRLEEQLHVRARSCPPLQQSLAAAAAGLAWQAKCQLRARLLCIHAVLHALHVQMSAVDHSLSSASLPLCHRRPSTGWSACASSSPHLRQATANCRRVTGLCSAVCHLKTPRSINRLAVLPRTVFPKPSPASVHPTPSQNPWMCTPMCRPRMPRCVP